MNEDQRERQANAPRQDQTRYQIMFDEAKNPRPIENFTAKQRAQFMVRCTELRAQGIKFTVWDTRNNGLSRLFSSFR